MKKFTNKVKFMNVDFEKGAPNQTKDTYIVTLEVRVPHLRSKSHFDTKKDTLDFIFKDVSKRLPYLLEVVEGQRSPYYVDATDCKDIIKFTKP